MKFRDLKQGDSLYMFDKDLINLKQVTINSILAPKVDMMGGSASFVNDITVNYNGSPKTYTVKSDAEEAYAGSLLITTDKNVVIREARSLKSNAEDVLNNTDKYKSIVDKCTSLIADFDPAIKVQEQNKARFEKLESSIDEIKKMIASLNVSNNKEDWTEGT